MRYYVISDVHSFYSETMQALSEKGFFEDKSPHKLIVCGDLFDRGSESVKMQNFICELLKNDDVILVRGNHEDLRKQKRVYQPRALLEPCPEKQEARS